MPQVIKKGMLSAGMLQAKFITAAVLGGGLYQTKLVLMVRMDTVWPALEFGCGLQMIAKRERDGTLELRHA